MVAIAAKRDAERRDASLGERMASISFHVSLLMNVADIICSPAQ
jgi:hypothetical protein